jgi:hypothetical protein
MGYIARRIDCQQRANPKIPLQVVRRLLNLIRVRLVHALKGSKPLKKALRHSSHLLKQGQSSTGLAYDLALVRIQIHEFKSVAVARMTAHKSSYSDRAARNGH